MKRAYIVCGPECSGNRLVAGLLVSAGCWGRGSDRQPDLDEFLALGADPTADMPDKIVVILHLEEYLRQWTQHLLELDYKVHFIVTARDPWVQVRSRSKAAHCEFKDSMKRYWQDYRAAFSVVAEFDGCKFTVITYESLLWKGAAKRFLSLFGLEQTRPLVVQGKETEITDQNGKWYAGS